MKYSPNQRLEPWVSPKVTVRVSPLHGRGFFAVETINEGEAAIKWGGLVVSEQDLRDGKVRPGSAAPLGDDLYLGDPINSPTATDYYLNHSCDPNLWMNDEITLVARREIVPGIELSADYALWESDPAWSLDPCLCSSPLCRGRVTGNDWRLPLLQSRYGDHFSPGLLKAIKSQG